MSFTSRYADTVRDRLKAWPILPLGASLKLGAVGVVRDGQFEPRGNADSILGAEVGEVSTGRTANWQLTSGSDVQVDFLADGTTANLFPSAPGAGARVQVSFGSSNSFLASANGISVSTLTNPAALLQSMFDAYERGTWRREYVLVYEVVVPDHWLILVSNESKSAFLLNAKADIAAPVGSADVAGKFGVSFQHKEALWLETSAQPVLYNAFRVKPGFWTGELEVQPLGAGDLTAGVFEQV